METNPASWNRQKAVIEALKSTHPWRPEWALGAEIVVRGEELPENQLSGPQQFAHLARALLPPTDERPPQPEDRC